MWRNSYAIHEAKMVALAIIIVVAIFAIYVALASVGEAERQQCFEYGYSELRHTNGEYYCYRLFNGTEQIVRLSEIGR